ncbi:alpha/beta hydrolase [Rhizobium sp. BK068]|uniref:alpha/beta fold hydrolase n=1 Tax=Rhizobium sp. BK068 TaxID=2512130 RepID=UPI0010466E82|nr:alpha/beta hydrolase [Rhizobium sp. BK068]TCM74950.1 pimeloyl-ACP methyl ester carboxylesterase [Rhizobium sp. BK068]
MSDFPVSVVPSQADWNANKKYAELANGVRVAYIEWGNPAGDPLLLLHGFTDSSRTWSTLLPHVRDRRVIALDLRGHGSTSAPETTYGLGELAHDVCLLVDELKIGRFDLVGHSLGSLIGQIIAAYHPEKIRNLVLIGSGTRAPAKPGSWLFENVMSMQFPLDPRGEFMNEWYANPFRVDAAFEDASRREAANIKSHVWKGVVRGLSFSDLLPLQPLIQSPLLIIWGDQDPLFVREDQDVLVSAHPRARFVAFEGSGHNPHWDFAGRVAEEIKAFAATPR